MYTMALLQQCICNHNNHFQDNKASTWIGKILLYEKKQQHKKQ